jgi:hypothetical protein
MSWQAYCPTFTVLIVKEIDFVSTIILLRRYWDDVRGHVDKGNTACRSEFIRILKKMAILHSKTNIPVACAARVIACHVESSYLNDEGSVHHWHPHRPCRLFCSSEINWSLKFRENWSPDFSPPLHRPMLSNAARSPQLATRSYSSSCCLSARSRRPAGDSAVL